MQNPSFNSVLELFLANNADDLSQPENFMCLEQNFRLVQQTLNKVRFLENIEVVLDKNGLTSMELGYDYESNDEGGTYISYNLTSAILADGRDFEEVEDDLYDVPYEIDFNYLDDSMAIRVVDSGPLSRQTLPALRNLLLTAPENEILNFFKISREQKKMNEEIPENEKKSDKKIKV